MNYHKSFDIKPLSVPLTRIYSVGDYLPSQKVQSNHLFEDLDSDRKYGIPTTWMSETMGIVERRVAAENTKPSELAILAAREAIESCTEIHPDQIDMVLYCGIERNYTEPATAHAVQDGLGLKAHRVFDISNACFGFNDGIDIANNFISSGSAKYVLLVTGEIMTRIYPSFIKQLKKGVSVHKARNLIGWFSLGDAGGAMIIGPSEPEDHRGFRIFRNNIDSSHVDKCHYELNTDGEYHGEMKMGKIVARGFQLHKEIIYTTMKSVGWEKFDKLLTHQTGRRNFEQIAKLGIVESEDILKTYDVLGNITSATLPVSYKKMINDVTLNKGCRIGGCFGGSGLTTGQFCYNY